MKIAAVSLVLLTLLAGGARADQASKMLKIDEMFRITKVDQMQQQMIDQMKKMLSAQMAQTGLSGDKLAQSEEFQRRIMAMVAERLSWDKMKPALVKVYDDTFTEEELTGILDFYKSAAGQAMIAKMPTLMSKSMAVGQEAMANTMPEVKKMMDDIAKGK